MLITASELTAKPGKSGELVALLTQMRDLLSKESGKDWNAWAAVAGRPYGSFGLSTTFENYADLIASQMKIAMSADWAALAAKADGILANPAPTSLSEVIAVTGELSGPRQFATVTRAVIDRSAMMDAIAWATQVAEYATKVTGVSTIVTTSAAGPMFGVSWLAGVDTPEELDKISALGADAGYLGMLADAGTNKLFEQGQSERFLLTKLA